MSPKLFPFIFLEIVIVIIMAVVPPFLPIVYSDELELTIPEDGSELDNWLNQTIEPLSSRKGSSFDRALVEAESNIKMIRVSSDGKADYRTIQDAIDSVPSGNTHRVIIYIRAGTYTEKIRIDRNKPFITLYGEQNNTPTLVFGGTAFEYGTVDSATLIVESTYFVGVNLNIVNSAPRPDGIRKGAQAVALRISGDKAAFFSCKFYGFQDTLCDDKGRHFFNTCYIEGTVDFIFGGGKSLYLNSEIHVNSAAGDHTAVITAHARQNPIDDIGFSFVHCKVTGSKGQIAFLGRAWMPYPRVVFAYSELSQVVNPQGWWNNNHNENNRTVYFAEYENNGAGSDLSKRASFTRKFNITEVKPYASLNFIEASKWLLPPPPKV